MRFGDAVRIEIDDRPNIVSHGWIIGLPPYSAGYHDVVMTAGDKWIGMPVNVRWCEVTGDDEAKASALRERFESEYPKWLKPMLTDPTTTVDGVVLRNGDTMEFVSSNTEDGLSISDVKITRATDPTDAAREG